MNNDKSTAFDEEWIHCAKESWMMNALEKEGWKKGGKRYLDNLRIWFESLPLDAKGKSSLKKRLESPRNEDHLGAVNELVWWEIMQRNGWTAEPVSKQGPDFKVLSPTKCYIEVTTLNVSRKDQSQFKSGGGVRLDDSRVIKQLHDKIIDSDEKLKQFGYAAKKRCPCGLIIFDFTTWSDFGTAPARNALIGDAKKKRLLVSLLPDTLSAIIIVIRRCLDGRIAIYQDHSIAYHNPAAQYPFPENTFKMFEQVDKGKIIKAKPCNKLIYL